MIIFLCYQPNVVYSDLDKEALNSNISSRNKSTNVPTEYAVIDQEWTASNQQQERLYANVGNNTYQDGNIYENFNNN